MKVKVDHLVGGNIAAPQRRSCMDEIEKSCSLP
jgi:hypothetical protein